MAPHPRAKVRNRRKTRGGKDGSSNSEFEGRVGSGGGGV